MSADCATMEVPDRCPTIDEEHAQILAMLPRGRAWRSPEGGPEPGSVLWGYWRAVAAEMQHVDARLCDLKAEFVCGTAAETLDLWQTDHGLPDMCDPFGDVCAKVAAQGGSRCEYFRVVAAAHGWSIDCVDVRTDCAARCDCAEADAAVAGGGLAPDRYVIIVHAGDSPAWTVPAGADLEADCYEADREVSCGPDLAPLQCLMERVIPAHLDVTYEVI